MISHNYTLRIKRLAPDWKLLLEVDSIVAVFHESPIPIFHVVIVVTVVIEPTVVTVPIEPTTVLSSHAALNDSLLIVAMSIFM